MRLSSWAALSSTIVIAGCVQAVTPTPTVTTTLEARVVVPTAAPVVVVSDPLEAFGGVYSIAGAPMADGCGGEIYLAAQTITIAPQARTLFADVVNRTYAARVEGQQMIAEGHFEARGTCPETAIYERWVLSMGAGRRLEGSLESLWPRAPTCSNPCLVTFQIAALPTQ